MPELVMNYETVKDCGVEIIPKELMGQAFMSPITSQNVLRNNKCCVRMNIVTPGALAGLLTICSENNNEYRCNLEVKYIQDSITNTCVNKLFRLLNTVLETNLNIIGAFNGKIYFY